MARPSKIHSFTIYEDTGIPTPDPAQESSTYDGYMATHKSDGPVTEQQESYAFAAGAHDDVQKLVLTPHEQKEDADIKRRESTLTSTSVSSLPISTYETEDDRALPMQPSYTIRPSFRQPESFRRMQVTSPPPFKSRSPRPSILNGSRSRAGRPRSINSGNARGSPRPGKKRVTEDSDTEHELEGEQHPLVLLHVTLLPINLPWRAESMQELLPKRTMEKLQLLRSKVTETVLKRGILIPHPRQEFDLLEEKLLEALELKEERVTKCGHFRSRDSTGSEGSGRDSDSGLGSSLDGSEGEMCETCRHHVKTSKFGVGTKSKKWSVKVYAANGLMRCSAWAAAWSEMESVDVEILPWIGDEMRRKLDERTEQERVDEHDSRESEEARINELVEEQVRRTYENMARAEEARRQQRVAAPNRPRSIVESSAPAVLPPKPTSHPLLEPAQMDLPQIYRPSQIPLSVLLKNYIYLLAQDRRNVIIFCLGIFVLLLTIRQGTAGKHDAMPSFADACARYQPLPSMVQPSAAGLGSATLAPEETVSGPVSSAGATATGSILQSLLGFDEPFSGGLVDEGQPEHAKEQGGDTTPMTSNDNEDAMEMNE
ncbi:hypothetical protein LTR37_006111 [Vermiconidia calcicola]|uniref:Uncharacterized protein n=1 Tax=Vermiconidia calcicola TaxID=1690605 RepID=A0ACC3NHS4_9PEZI|nr:hypothetical protein LTR37_006111 [Vermiconidia calcicola]